MEENTTSYGNEWRLTEDGRVYRKGSRRYANGDLYTGEIVDNMKHGRGTLIYHSGDRYQGEFENNLFHGFGVYTWAPFEDIDSVRVRGKRYEGHYVKGRRCGEGVYYSGRGEVYEGSFKADLYHGEGYLQTPNGDKFRGSFARGRLYGQGSAHYVNGDVYRGLFFGGAYHGHGHLEYAHGRGWYEGEFRIGRFHGKGVRVYMNGNRYEGEFADNQPDGQGAMTYVSGEQYIGQWSRGKPHGQGVLRYAHGDRYDGNFCEGVFYGRGRYVWADGGFYDGEFIRNMEDETGAIFPYPNGKRNGFGVRVTVSGARYEGRWVDDRLSGYVVVTKPEGGKFKGIMENSLRHGEGEEQFGNERADDYVCPLGYKHRGSGYCVYTGSYRLGKFDGYGELICQDGRQYRGHWKTGERHGNGMHRYVTKKHLGDSKRMFIGAGGSLYRTKEYHGEWSHGNWQGTGKQVYVNNDTIEGNFTRGLPHGVVVYTFATTGLQVSMQYTEGGTKQEVLGSVGSVNPESLRSSLDDYGSSDDEDQASQTSQTSLRSGTSLGRS